MDLRHYLEWLAELLASLAPSLIGSAAAQAWKPGLPWRERVLQWIVGSTVSYYATLAIIAVTGWNAFIAQSIAFAIALLAFDATPAIARAVVDVLVSMPDRFANKFLPPKD
jgi:hypothetical protein